MNTKGYLLFVHQNRLLLFDHSGYWSWNERVQLVSEAVSEGGSVFTAYPTVTDGLPEQRLEIELVVEKKNDSKLFSPFSCILRAP